MTRVLLALLTQLLGWVTPELQANTETPPVTIRPYSGHLRDTEDKEKETQDTGPYRTEALFILKNRRNSLAELVDVARSRLKSAGEARLNITRRSLNNRRSLDDGVGESFVRGIYPEYLQQLHLFQDAVRKAIVTCESARQPLLEKEITSHIDHATILVALAECQERILRFNQELLTQQKQLGRWQRQLKGSRARITRSFSSMGRSSNGKKRTLSEIRLNCAKYKFTLNKIRQACKISEERLRNLYIELPEEFKNDAAVRRATLFLENLDAARIRLIS